MTCSILSLLIATVFSLSQVWGIRPSMLVPVSSATCQPDYAWMNNAEQLDPCLAVAYVIAACAGDTWTQPALPSGYSYNSPNGATATPCYCSWSCYNLMMACTLCQNPAYTSDITTWPSFSQNCSLSYKDEMFPQGYVLLNNASIPYWATIDPTSWPSELFNVTQAEDYANQNLSDYWPSNSSPSSSGSGNSTNLGAIIGGAVGGVALLVILVGGYFLYERRQHWRLDKTNGATPILRTGTPTTAHTRWPSDPSTLFLLTQEGSPDVTTQSHGKGSGESVVISPTSYSVSQAGPPPPPTETESFFTAGGTVVQRTRAIPMV